MCELNNIRSFITNFFCIQLSSWYPFYWNSFETIFLNVIIQGQLIHSVPSKPNPVGSQVFFFLHLNFHWKYSKYQNVTYKLRIQCITIYRDVLQFNLRNLYYLLQLFIRVSFLAVVVTSWWHTLIVFQHLQHKTQSHDPIWKINNMLLLFFWQSDLIFTHFFHRYCIISTDILRN